MRNKLRRPLAFLLSAVMIVTMSGTPVHAVADRGQPETGLCEHHTAHTDDCGYTEETPGTPCGHEHTEDCYTEVTECVHEHTPECYRSETEDSVSDNEATPANAEEREPENCPHICDGESGCITEKLDCRHEHDSECGYTESTPGTPCTYVCEICNPQDSGEADEEPETGIIKQEQCSCLTLCTEGQINPDCLVCGAENADLSDCKGKAEKEDTKQPEDTGICKHHQEHDDACDYQPESEDGAGIPCTYDCRICPIEDLIAVLLDKVTEDNAENIRAQLDKILALFAELSEDEQEQIDLSRCYELQEALDAANGVMPLAEGTPDLELFGQKVCSGDSGEGWSYANGVLTLENYHSDNSGEVFIHMTNADLEFTLYLKGDNSVKTSEKLIYGNAFGSITITGDSGASLSLDGKSWADRYIFIRGVNVDVTTQDMIFISYDMEIDNATVSFNMSGPNGYIYTTHGGFTIKNGSDVTITNSSGTVDYCVATNKTAIAGSTLKITNPSGFGVYVTKISTQVSEYKASITNSTISAYVSDAGIHCEDEVSVTSSQVTNSGQFLLRSKKAITMDDSSTMEGITCEFFKSDTGAAYQVYGSHILAANLTVEGNGSFAIPEGAALTIPAGVTLENNGTMRIHKKDSLTGTGTLTGNGKFLIDINEDMISVPEDLVYTGEDLTETIRERASLNGEVTICGKTFTASTDGWVLNVVKRAELTYSVSYTCAGESISKDVIIAARSLAGADITIPGSYTYTGQAHTPDPIVIVDGLTLVKSKDYNVTYTNNVNAGTATVSVIGIGTYTGKVEKTFTIQQATATLAWEGTTQELLYTGQPAAITAPAVKLINNEQFGGTIKYSYTKAGETMSIDGLPIDAGIYTIKARVEAKGNYAAADSTNTLTLIIKPTPVALTFNDQTITYGNPAAKATANPASAKITYSYTGTATGDGWPVNVGTYTVIATVKATGNYKEATATAQLVINKAALTATGATVASKTYDGTNTAAVSSVTFTGLLDGETLALNTDYTATGEFADENAGTGKNVSIAVALKDSVKANNYNLTNSSVNTAGNITKASQTAPHITGLPTGAITYGDTFTLHAESGVNWSASGAVTVDSSGKVTVTGVGEAAITATKLGSSNYEPAEDQITFIAVPKVLTVTGLTAEDRAYDGTNAVTISSVALSGILGSDTVSVNTTGLTGTLNGSNAGSYTAVTLPRLILTGGAASNYTLTQPAGAVPASVTIRKAPALSTKTSDLAVANKEAHTYTCSLGALRPDVPEGISLGNSAVTYTLGTVSLGRYYDSAKDGVKIEGQTLTLPIQAVESNEEIEIGTITVIIHTQNFEDMTATIKVRSTNKQSVDISGVTLTGRAYNGSPIEYQQTATASVDGKTVSVKGFVYTWNTPDHAAPVNAGNYTLTVSVDPEDQNYTGSTTIPVVIEQAEIRVTAPSKTIYVGETAPVFSAADCTITGLAQGENLKTPPTVVYAEAPDTSKTGSVAVTASGAKVPEGGNYKDQIVYENGTLTITSKPLPPAKYTVTVQAGKGGTASASPTSAEKGTKITLTATPDNDYHFKEWQVISGGVTISDNIFTMPAANVTVKAMFEKDSGTTPPQPTEYSVTFDGNGGTSPAAQTTTGGKLTNLPTSIQSGYSFNGWYTAKTGGDKITLDTVFTASVTVYAQWTKNSSGGSSGNEGSSGGSSSGSSGSSSGDNGSSGGGSTIVVRPDEAKPEIPTTSQTKPAAPDKNGNVEVDDGTVQSAINMAKNDAKENGNTTNGVAVVIPITPKEGQNSFHVTINAQTLNTLVRENVKRLEINIEGVVVGGLDTKLLKWLDTLSANGDIIFRVKQTDPSGLSKEAKAAIGTRPVYDLSLVYLSGGKETPITDFDGHTIAVRLPYAPAKDEKTGNLYAVYVDGKGKVEWLTKSSYDPDLGTVVFETGHFSIYGIGYKNPVPVFTDIKNHWAEDNIIFVASRGLLAGTGNNQFSPDTGMTRGMFVTALGRLAGIDPDSYKTGKFTDVKADAYYAPYVNWAAEKGIVNGTSATTFSPDTNITREQMAVIMANYAKKLGYDLPAAHEAVTFADNAQISSWAEKDVKAMQQAGIMAGKDGNRFDPKGTATCAEVATVLRRFVEIVIDPQAAQGWMQNHSGSWQYMKNGKPVTGWLQDGEKWYWLDNNGWMFSGGWKQIGGKWYYFYTDGFMAVNTTIDGYTIGPDGARK